MFKIDDFSFHPNLVYQTHHYIVCILEYLIYSFLGYNGLHVLEVILTVTIAILFYLDNKYFVKNKFISYIFVFVELFALRSFITLRAQMYSYIIFLLEIYMINKLLDTRKKCYVVVLTLLPFVLANVHSGTIFFYFIILGVYMLNIIKFKFSRFENDKRFDKKMFICFILIFIIGASLTLINPYGYRAITYGIKTINDSFINNNIMEFLPYSIRDSNGKIVFFYLAFIYLSLILSRKNINFEQLFLTGGTTLMLLLSKRHFSMFIISTICVYPHIKDIIDQIIEKIKEKGTQKNIKIIKNMIYVIFACAYIGYISNSMLSLTSAFDDYVPENKYPVAAVEYIKENVPNNAHIFNDYAWGSYLIFNDIKVYIDSRADLYTPEYNEGVNVAQDYMDTINCKKYYGDIVKKYDIDYFLIKKNVALATMLNNDKNYKVVYSDDISYIFKVLNK